MEVDSEAVSSYMNQLLDKYEGARGKAKLDCEFPLWDAVVITAADADQKKGFDRQIRMKKEKGQLPNGIFYHVVADPKGPKIGTGGSTLHALAELKEIYSDQLFDMRVLLIHSGGQSQRLPTASVLGKLFTTLPLGDSMLDMFDLKLAMYAPFIKMLPPGVMVTCADDVETYILPQDFDMGYIGEGVWALGHQSCVEIGKNHGVYVLPEPDNINETTTPLLLRCSRVLQKPTEELMKQTNAIDSEGVVCTDSVFYITRPVMEKLLDFYDREKPLKQEVDAYGDFLQPLGTGASDGYILGVKENALREIKRKLFNLLKDQCSLDVLLLRQSHFHHLGTMEEYVLNLLPNTRDTKLSKNHSGAGLLFTQLGFQTWNSSSMAKFGKELKPAQFDEANPDVTVIHSYLPEFGKFSAQNSVLEWCDVRSSVVLGKWCILSHCGIDAGSVVQLIIPERMCFHTVPVNFENRLLFVTVAFKLDDDLKRSVAKERIGQLVYLGRKLSENYHAIWGQGIKLEDHFTGGNGVSASCSGTNNMFNHGNYNFGFHYNNYTAHTGLTSNNVSNGQAGSTAAVSQVFNLWNAKLFYPAPSMESSFLFTLQQVSKVLCTGDDSLVGNLDIKTPRTQLSMADVVRMKDMKEMIRYKDKLLSKIVL